ncbi:MAG: 16S rRNA (guanine(527)-N(7))-methyltransferase RsmG, partial [Thermodesulfobacteriota bacterium]
MGQHKIVDMLVAGAKELSIEMREGEERAFLIYLEELKKWNEKINLTSLRSDRDIAVKHFLDSLTVARFLKDAGVSSLLDIGSGGGFPGIPIKIVMPELKVTLLEAIGKKVIFLKHIIRTLGLNNIEAIKGRAEDEDVIKLYGNSFDCVISRALSSIKDYIGLAEPYIKVTPRPTPLGVGAPKGAGFPLREAIATAGYPCEAWV